jgi:hypothetical protein
MPKTKPALRTSAFNPLNPPSVVKYTGGPIKARGRSARGADLALPMSERPRSRASARNGLQGPGGERGTSLTAGASAYKDDGFVNYGARGGASPLRAHSRRTRALSDARRSRSLALASP